MIFKKSMTMVTDELDEPLGFITSEYFKVKLLSHVRPSVTLWTAAHQAPPSMGFSRQEYWSGVPLPSPLLNL